MVSETVIVIGLYKLAVIIYYYNMTLQKSLSCDFRKFKMYVMVYNTLLIIF